MRAHYAGGRYAGVYAGVAVYRYGVMVYRGGRYGGGVILLAGRIYGGIYAIWRAGRGAVLYGGGVLQG